MLHLKLYVQKICYSSTMPSRKYSHYRYQNENLHLLPHFGHVFFNSHQILSQTWDTQSPHRLFFCTVRAGLFHCSWSKLAPSLGTRYLVWSPRISWILLKGSSSSTVCERNFVTNMGLGLLCSVKHRTCSVSFWKLLLKTGQCSLYQVTLRTEKACCLGGFNIKADLPMFYMNLILIWRYKDSYCSLSNL